MTDDRKDRWFNMQLLANIFADLNQLLIAALTTYALFRFVKHFHARQMRW
jgi:hypothetical protein